MAQGTKDYPDVSTRSQQLRERSERLRHTSRRLREDVERYQRTLLSSFAPPPEAPAPPLAEPPDRRQIQLRALRAIVAVLVQFPIEDQVAMVKVLAARTLIIAHDRARLSTVLSA